MDIRVGDIVRPNRIIRNVKWTNGYSAEIPPGLHLTEEDRGVVVRTYSDSAGNMLVVHWISKRFQKNPETVVGSRIHPANVQRVNGLDVVLELV